MIEFIRQRVAPISALLVISLSIGLVLFTNRPAITPPATPVVEDTPEIPATITPTDIPAPTQLSQDDSSLHQARGQLQVALYHLEAEAQLEGWSAERHIRAGNLWRDMGDPAQALPHWEAAMTTEANANLLRQIAEIYIERGEWSIAWQRIQQLLELTPNNAWGLYHGGLILAPSDPSTAFGFLGRVAALNNEFSTTAQAVLEAVGDTETNSDVILRVGIELAAAEEWSLAENAYQYASDLYFPFAEATAYAGLMRILQGKNGSSWIEEAVALDSTNPDVHYIAGVYWRAAGEFLRSEDHLIEAIILEPENPTYHAELGNTYRAMGNMLDAEVWLQTAVILSDEDPILVDTLERFYREENFVQAQAIIGFDPASQVAQNVDAEAVSASGWASHLRGNSAAGLAIIEQALLIDPDNPRALFDKARILLETSRVDEAIPLLEQLISGRSVFSGVAQGLLERERPLSGE